MSDMNDRFLKTGIFLAPFHPLHENPLLAIDRDMELLEHLDRLNYHEAWIGEHHSAGFEIIACPEMFIAAAAERTRHIRLGTGVVSLPYHNPFTVAGRMMQLDYMTRGRAMFGVGPGSLVYDATKMGLKAEDQRRKLDESLDVIMELMQGRMVTKKTDWFDLQEARLQLKSYSQPMMEMAVASSRSPTGALAAGKHGIGMLSIGGTSDDALKAHASNWGVYEESARANGKTPDRRKWRIVTFAHVAETTRAGARGRQVRPRGLQALFHRGGDLPHHPARRHGRPGRVPGVVRPRLHRHARAIACAISSGCGRAPTAASAASCCWRTTGRTGRRPSSSYELMARYVHPHFQRNANELRDWSYDDAKDKYATAGAAIESRGAGGHRQVPGAQGLNPGRAAARPRPMRVLSVLQPCADYRRVGSVGRNKVSAALRRSTSALFERASAQYGYCALRRWPGKEPMSDQQTLAMLEKRRIEAASSSTSTIR